mmetsp:Transcript_3328/g.3833  ORF Transcript_3328/g.3833 Transcript_3328/m.3833 type:complete len:85 (+) Transcript_3328:749-1003(+)
MSPRRTIAPDTPQDSTRFCSCGGMRKYSNSIINTNKLSIERDCSIKYPAKNSYPDSTPRVAMSVRPNIAAEATVKEVLMRAYLY